MDEQGQVFFIFQRWLRSDAVFEQRIRRWLLDEPVVLEPADRVMLLALYAASLDAVRAGADGSVSSPYFGGPDWQRFALFRLECEQLALASGEEADAYWRAANACRQFMVERYLAYRAKQQAKLAEQEAEVRAAAAADAQAGSAEAVGAHDEAARSREMVGVENSPTRRVDAASLRWRFVSGWRGALRLWRESKWLAMAGRCGSWRGPMPGDSWTLGAWGDAIVGLVCGHRMHQGRNAPGFGVVARGASGLFVFAGAGWRGGSIIASQSCQAFLGRGPPLGEPWRIVLRRCIARWSCGDRSKARRAVVGQLFDK